MTKAINIITRNEKGERVNASTLREYGADLDSLRDASAEVQAIAKDFEALIDRLRAAANNHGYVYEQCYTTADALVCLVHDEFDSAVRILNCAIHDQGGHHG